MESLKRTDRTQVFGQTAASDREEITERTERWTCLVSESRDTCILVCLGVGCIQGCTSSYHLWGLHKLLQPISRCNAGFSSSRLAGLVSPKCERSRQGTDWLARPQPLAATGSSTGGSAAARADLWPRRSDAGEARILGLPRPAAWRLQQPHYHRMTSLSRCPPCLCFSFARHAEHP